MLYPVFIIPASVPQERMCLNQAAFQKSKQPSSIGYDLRSHKPLQFSPLGIAEAVYRLVLPIKRRPWSQKPLQLRCERFLRM